MLLGEWGVFQGPLFELYSFARLWTHVAILGAAARLTFRDGKFSSLRACTCLLWTSPLFRWPASASCARATTRSALGNFQRETEREPSCDRCVRCPLTLTNPQAMAGLCFRASAKSLLDEHNAELWDTCWRCNGWCDLVRHVSPVPKSLFEHLQAFGFCSNMLLASGHCKHLEMSPFVSTSRSCSLVLGLVLRFAL